MWNRKANRIADLEARLNVALRKREPDEVTETAAAIENRRLRTDLATTKANLSKTEDQLGESRKRVAILVDQLGTRPTPSQELRDARREMLLLRRQTVELTQRLKDLQKANETAYASGALAEVTAP
jgi:hypothetical protein